MADDDSGGPQLVRAAIRLGQPTRLAAFILGVAGMGAGGVAAFRAHLEAPPVALLAAGLILALVGMAGVMPTRLKAGDNEAEFLEQRLATALKEGVESAPLTSVKAPQANSSSDQELDLRVSTAGIMEDLLDRIAKVSPEVAAPAQSALEYERLVQEMASRLMSLPGMQQVSSGRSALAIFFETHWSPPGRMVSVQEFMPYYTDARDLAVTEPGDEIALIIATPSSLNGKAKDFVATRPGLYHALVRGPGDEDSLKRAIEAALTGPPLR
jgi:hypothetical protein